MMFEIPTTEINQPKIEYYAEATFDAFASSKGGKSNEKEFIYLINTGMSYNLTPSVQVRGGLWLTNNNSVSQFVGDDQIISNIESGISSLRFSELVVEWQSENWSVLSGIYDLNSEFDVLDSSSIFINSAHGIGTDIGQTGNNGPSIYPTPGLAFRLTYTIDEHTFRVATVDGLPGNENNPNSQSLALDSDEGALLIAEYQYQTLNKRLLAGKWYYTAEFENLAKSNHFNNGNIGYYIRGEWDAIEIENSQQVTLFGRYGIADGRYNKYDKFISFGINMPSFISSRYEDRWGIAVARVELAEESQTSYSANAETNIELTYDASLTDYLSIQPNIQYLISPAASKQIDNAWALGLRINYSIM